MNFTFNGKKDSLIFIEDGFTFPSMSKKTQYHESTHKNYRKRKRSVMEPFSFSIPFIVRNEQNKLTRDEVSNRLFNLIYSDGPGKFQLKDTEWYFYGEFNGPYYLPPIINGFTQIELEFTCEIPYKISSQEIVKEGTSININTKTQLPLVPLIELTGLTGTDVQISVVGNSLKKIRLTGTLPATLTIDIENESIYETNSKIDKINLLRVDSEFEDFTLKNGEVVVVNNGKAKLKYRELFV